MKKKKKVSLKLTSVLLTLCLMLSVVFSAPIAVTAKTVDSRNDITVSDNAVSKVESIEANEEVKRTPVRRLYEEEGDDLNKTVWLNDDGTRTMTVYDYPVKFVNSAGQIQDISLDVAEANDGSGAFKTAAGWVDTVFPSKITDGVTLSANGEALRLTPVMPQGSLVASAERSNKLVAKDNVARKDTKTVSYNYDSKTNIEYSLTYNGFKEDIVVNEYTGQTEYSFFLETNGLTLVNNNGSYHLEDAEGNVKASVGDVIIFTADERNNTMGYMTHTTVKENHSYFINIHVDAEWLKDEKTVYPIRIDPTLEMTSTQKVVEDVTIYSGGASNPTSTILCVGNREDLGVSRVLMKFPNLDLSAIANSKRVVSAGVKLYDLYKQTDPMGVYCYIYDGNNWEDDSATWANNANGYTHFMSHNDVSRENIDIQVDRNWYYFSITDAVKYWLLTDEERAARPDNYDMEKGIMLKAKDDMTMGYQYKAFGSYNNATYRPVIEIVYSETTDTVSQPFGWFDRVNANEIRGWAWCFDYPETSLICEIVLYNESKDKEYRYCCFSNLNRGDVALAGYGTGAYGFRFPVDWNALSRGKYRVEVFAYGLNDEQKYLLPQSPQTFNNSRYLITPSNFTGSMLKGETVQLSATTVLDHVDVSWLSSDSDVVSVSQTGLATAKNAGKATITAKFTNPNTGSVALEQVNITVVSDLIGLSDLTLNVGNTVSLEDYLYRADSYNPSVRWRSSNANIVEVNELTGVIKAKSVGTAAITVTNEDGSYSDSVHVHVNLTKIYQTKDTFRYKSDGTLPEDLEYNDISVNDLRALDWINWSDFVLTTPSDFRASWEDMCITFFTKGQMETVILDMIDHFMSGSGTNYSNTTLTNRALEHESTQNYITSVKECVSQLLNQYNGDITALSYVASDRDNNPLVQLMKSKNIYQPVYNTAGDKTTGLRICIDSLWGNQVEIKSYNQVGNSYSGVLSFTLYDHFGLDAANVEKYGLLAGFRSWYILQHSNEYNGAYKPFVTVINFEVPFSGTIG